jgi:hypothetical protein
MCRRSYRVSIAKKTDMLLFCKEIGCIGRQEELNNLLSLLENREEGTVFGNPPKDFFNVISNIAKNKNISISNIEKNTGAYLRKNRGVGNSILNRIGVYLNDENLIDMSSGDLYWDEIVKITECGVEDVYDLQVIDGEPNFIANDIVVHNSTCLAGWGINICYHSNVPVLYLDTEMGEKMFGYRMISNLTKIPYKELTNRTFTHDNDTIEALDLAVELIESGRFKYKYLPRFTPDSLRYEIKKFIKQEGYGVVFFDYIKLPDGLDLKFANETQQLGYLATALKSIGGELGIPIVTAVQYNRDAVGKEGNLSSAYISASDRILHYADTILSLRRLSMKELAFVNSRFGVDANINGCMQILDSRSSPPDMDGIYLSMDLSRASITEASEQPSSGEMVGVQGDSDD